MTKRVLSAVAGFLACYLSSSAWAQPQPFGSLDSAVPRLPSLALSNAGNFSFASGFQWAEARPDFLPTLNALYPANSQRARTNVAAVDLSKDSSKELVELKRTSLFDYATGEVGFMYGKSTGKYGVESEQGYIIGEVGNDHLHISAGASYENVNGRLPRFVR
jgi:hypothetical protein